MAVQTVIDWATIRDAIYDWFFAATELPTIWADQDAPQALYPYATLNVVGGPRRIGGKDNIIRTTDLGQVGEEVELSHEGPRLFTVGCQIHVGQSTDANGIRQEPSPASNARALMSTAEAALEFETARQLFKDAALAFVRTFSVQSLDVVIAGEFISRVQMDVEFATKLKAVERVTFIEKIEITGTFEPPEGPPTFDEDFSVDSTP